MQGLVDSQTWTGGSSADSHHARLQTHALANTLMNKDLLTVDEFRRAIEGLGAKQYSQASTCLPRAFSAMLHACLAELCNSACYHLPRSTAHAQS